MIWRQPSKTTAGLLAAALFMGAWTGPVCALPLPAEPGLNTLTGRAAGAEENYVGVPGDYIMPNGSTSGSFSALQG